MGIQPRIKKYGAEFRKSQYGTRNSGTEVEKYGAELWKSLIRTRIRAPVKGHRINKYRTASKNTVPNPGNPDTLGQKKHRIVEKQSRINKYGAALWKSNHVSKNTVPHSGNPVTYRRNTAPQGAPGAPQEHRSAPQGAAGAPQAHPRRRKARTFRSLSDHILVTFRTHVFLS